MVKVRQYDDVIQFVFSYLKNKQPVEEWVCKHSSHTATEEENLHWTTVYK